MSTVASFPLDSFLPSGALDHGARVPFLSSDSSSLISPLALPRGATGFFDALPIPTTSHSNSPVHLARANGSSASQANKVHSPLSPAFRAIPQPQPLQFLSPTLAPTTKHPYRLQLQPRPASLSPVDHSVSAASGNSAADLGLPEKTGRSVSSTEPVTSGLGDFLATAQHGLVDATVEHPQLQTIQRLLHQNTRIRSAWEAERKYLEANRERAEEVYKEEQALMEEDRIAWDAERTQLLQKIQVLLKEKAEWTAEKSHLLQQVEVLRQTVSNLHQNRTSDFAHRGGSTDSGKDLQRGWSAESARGGDGSQDSKEGSFHPFSHNTSLAPIRTDVGVIGQGQKPSPQRTESSSSSGHLALNIPGPSLFTGAMASPDKVESAPVPIVDVQEIHPDLEGIPIKALAIQKPTFLDDPSLAGSRSTSRIQSPTEAGKPTVVRQESRNQTLQILAAKESVRLTMHAGHTPSHSLSLLPTATASVVSTGTNSGDRTPTNGPRDAVDSPPPAADDASSRISFQTNEPPEPAPTKQENTNSEEHPEPLFDAPEDRELKGPLMIRNIPATDEIFLRKLSDRLEEVRQSPNIAVPAVLKDPVDEKLSELSQPEAGTDGIGEHPEEPGKDKSPSNEGDELEVPLKIKKSNNFGAPFGEWR